MLNEVSGRGVVNTNALLCVPIDGSGVLDDTEVVIRVSESLGSIPSVRGAQGVQSVLIKRAPGGRSQVSLSPAKGVGIHGERLAGQ